MAEYILKSAPQGTYIIKSLQITIQHGDTLFSPPIKDDVQLEHSRDGSPGKLTFTVVKIMDNSGMSFDEGDQVCFYANGVLRFVGYVFKKKRDKEHHIEVTCYDKLRYLKNKYAYVFVNKTATEIVQAMCKDYNLPMGEIADTKYRIPSIAEENKEAIDIILTALEETLMNTGDLYVLMDNCGKIELKNCADMKTATTITAESAQNFDYSTSIDDSTYNSVVLYYKPGSTTQTVGDANPMVNGTFGSATGQASTIVSLALQQVGVSEQPKGSNHVKYLTELGVSNSAWCCYFITWLFRKSGLGSLFCGGDLVGKCSVAASWFKGQGRFYNSNPQVGDIVYYTNGSRISHTGIVVGVNSDGSFTTVEGNWGDKVSKCTVPASGSHSGQRVAGFGRPAYS